LTTAPSTSVTTLPGTANNVSREVSLPTPCPHMKDSRHLVKTITSEIEDAVRAARSKHPVQSHPDGTSATFYGPLARICTEKTDLATKNGMLLWVDILKEEVFEAFAEEDPKKIRKELLQSAAVIVNWIKDIDSRG
jgi:hypothetical protein